MLSLQLSVVFISVSKLYKYFHHFLSAGKKIAAQIIFSTVCLTLQCTSRRVLQILLIGNDEIELEVCLFQLCRRPPVMPGKLGLTELTHFTLISKSIMGKWNSKHFVQVTEFAFAKTKTNRTRSLTSTSTNKIRFYALTKVFVPKHVC